MLNIFLLQPWRRGPAWGDGGGGGGGEGPSGRDEAEVSVGVVGGAAADVSVDSGVSADAGSGDVGIADVDTSVAEVDTSDGGFLGVSDGGSGYVDVDSADATSSADVGDADFGMGSIDGVSDVGVSDTGSGGVDFDSGGDYLGEFGGSGVDLGTDVSAGAPENDFDFGAGSTDGVGTSAGEGDVGISIDPYDNPYAIDIADTNIYTLNDDGTYSIEDGEPDPEPDFDPDEYLGGPGDGEGGGTTTTTNTLPSSFDRVEYNFNTSLEASPYGGMWSNITSTIPKYEFDAY